MAIPAVQIDDLLKDGEPDWPNIEFEINCSRCGYNLRMLERSRCPECGLEFEWRVMLEIAATGSDFLFEHNWRKRPLGSFAATTLRSFRPRRFWAAISLHERISLGPLLFMFASGIVSFSIVLHGGALVIAGVMEGVFRVFESPSPFSSQAFQIQRQMFALAEAPLKMGRQTLILMIPPILTLAGTVGLLLLLRETLAKCRVREAQVFRVMAYMAIPIAVWSALTILLGTSVMIFVPSGYDSWIFGFEPGFAVMLIMFVMVAAIITRFLAAGLRDYLLLPRPRILAATAATVGILFMLAALVLLALVLRF